MKNTMSLNPEYFSRHFELNDDFFFFLSNNLFYT